MTIHLTKHCKVKYISNTMCRWKVRAWMQEMDGTGSSLRQQYNLGVSESNNLQIGGKKTLSPPTPLINHDFHFCFSSFNSKEMGHSLFTSICLEWWIAVFQFRWGWITENLRCHCPNDCLIPHFLWMLLNDPRGWEWGKKCLKYDWLEFTIL